MENRIDTTDKQSDIVAELRRFMAACDDYTSHPMPSSLPGELIDKGSDIAFRAADELERLRVVCRANIGTLDWTRQRLIQYGKPHGEIDCAIEETARALSRSATKEATE